jgi:hypothetical protein
MVFAATPVSGVRVEARLLHSISTYSTKAGAPVEALLTTSLCRPDGSELPEGATLVGAVTRVHRVGLGLIHETASLELSFDRLHLPDGSDYPAAARLVGIDSARERIDRHGIIHGARATATLSNRFGERLVFLAMGHPLAMTPLFVLENGMFHFPDPEIEYHRGTELYLEITPSEPLAGLQACPVTETPVAEDDMAELRHLVDELPYWSESRRQRQPIDMVNLLFVGPEESVRNAFQAAGWTGSVPNSMGSGVRAIRAIVDDGPYREAPMRTLLLDGAEPDMRLQKSLNTFEKRHHLRIWKRNAQWQGQDLWAAAATTDIAATFSMRPFGFTHEIEDHIDLEREKVVSDLEFTGCVDSVRYVRRPATVRTSGQPYRRGVNTDARIAVVTFNACTGPRMDLNEATTDPPPSGFVRVVRRIVLTARNHFLRDNIVWRTGDALRLGFLTLRQWDNNRKDENRARKADLAMAKDGPQQVPSESVKSTASTQSSSAVCRTWINEPALSNPPRNCSAQPGQSVATTGAPEAAMFSSLRSRMGAEISGSFSEYDPAMPQHMSDSYISDSR